MKDQFEDGRIIVDNAIGFWIHRVYQASRNQMYRVFRAHGEDVTPEQWAVLIRLWERDGQPQTELSAATFRDAPTMSRSVDGLEGRVLDVAIKRGQRARGPPGRGAGLGHRWGGDRHGQRE